nr:MamM protein (Magnetosome protein MamM, Cation efflux protein family) (Magnetosome protein MamM) [uncultured bacterium]
MKYEKCARCSRTIGWVGLVVSTVLMCMKAFVGVVSGSRAMLADAMYSAKDVAGAALVIVGMSVSRKSLDHEHPFGHGKIEFILSLFLSFVFMVVTAGLFIHSVNALLDFESHKSPHLIALWAALVSIGVNVAMYLYSRCVATETGSPLVQALAKHHHSDGISSVAVALGIVGSHYLDMPWIDPLVAVNETLHLMYLGGDVFWDSVKGLMDHSVDKPLRNRLVALAEGVEGVEEVVLVRARHVGQEISAEMVIGVDSNLSIEEAHAIGETVKERAAAAIPRLGLLKITTKSRREHAEQMDELRSQWKLTKRKKGREDALEHEG